MKYNPDIHHRRSIRLKGYDYTQAGAYYITICTQGKVSLFGEIVDGEMWLNEIGWIVDDSWNWLQNQYDYVQIAEYVVMPNHLHGILVIRDNRGGRDDRDDHVGWDERRRGGSRTAPTATHPPTTGNWATGNPTTGISISVYPTNDNSNIANPETGYVTTNPPITNPAIRKTLGRLIGAFKTVSTKRINEIWKTPGTQIYQRNYYEHIIRDDNEYQRIAEYIINNPRNWDKDDLFSKEKPE